MYSLAPVPPPNPRSKSGMDGSESYVKSNKEHELIICITEQFKKKKRQIKKAFARSASLCLLLKFSRQIISLIMVNLYLKAELTNGGRSCLKHDIIK